MFKLNFKYRWYYAALITLLFFAVEFYCEIRPFWQSQRQIKHKIENLKKEIAFFSQQPSLEESQPMQTLLETNVTALQQELAATLNQIAFKNQVTVTRFNLSNLVSLQSKALIASLELHGDHAQLSALMSAIFNLPYLFTIRELIYEPEKERLQLNMWFYSQKSLHASKALNFPHFLCGNFRYRFISEDYFLQKISIYELRFIGFLKAGERVRAILQSSDEEHFFTVEPHNIIGKEKAEIMEITPRFISIRLPDQQYLYLKK